MQDRPACRRLISPAGHDDPARGCRAEACRFVANPRAACLARERRAPGARRPSVERLGARDRLEASLGDLEIFLTGVRADPDAADRDALDDDRQAGLEVGQLAGRRVGEPELQAVLNTVLTDPDADPAALLEDAAASAQTALDEQLRSQ